MNIWQIIIISLTFIKYGKLVFEIDADVEKSKDEKIWANIAMTFKLAAVLFLYYKAGVLIW